MSAVEGMGDTTGAALAALVEAPAAPIQAKAPRSTSEIMADALVQRGILTREQVDAEIAKESSGEGAVEPSAQPDRIADDENTDSVLNRAAEAAFAPPTTPGGYVIDRTPSGLKHTYQLESTFRAIAHDSGLDAPFVADIARRWNAAAAAPPMTAAQIEAREINAFAQLAREWGDQYNANLSLAKSFVAGIAAKHPSVTNLLEASGLGNDPAVVKQMYLRALARRKT